MLRRPRPRPSTTSLARLLPAAHVVLLRDEVREAERRHGRAIVTAVLRERLAALRSRARRGTIDRAALETAALGIGAWVAAEAERRLRTRLVPVLNATGVVLHTNLGRAPLSAEAVRRVAAVAGAYSTLEYEIDRGGRGSRASHLERLAAILFPGRALQVANNNAAALLLALNTLAEGREVVVSRGELVEIGGSFRVPEILAKSGALLREVGTTNKTRLQDYARALGPRTGLLLKVHPSNYRIVGFTATVAVRDLAALARRHGVPLLMDQGSGALLDLAAWGIRGEPTVAEILAEGADLVCCSGDKLLGGPQAGLLVGRPDLIAATRRNPLARALRVDKMIHAALEAALAAHATGRALEEAPVLRMIARTRESIARRATALRARLRERSAGALSLEVRDGVSLTGGGSAPGEGLPTSLLLVRPAAGGASGLERALRAGTPPVVARIEEGAVVLDLRTIEESDDAELEGALLAAAAALARRAPAGASAPDAVDPVAGGAAGAAVDASTGVAAGGRPAGRVRR